LTRSTMWEWFTKKGELKENYMEATLEQQWKFQNKTCKNLKSILNCVMR
jgi:hypothetical protein